MKRTICLSLLVIITGIGLAFASTSTIPNLTALTTPATDDIMVIEDVTAPSTTKKITMANLKTFFSKSMGTTGGLNRTLSEATATLSGATTTIEVNVPATSRIRGIQLRVDTAVTSGDGGTTWTATLSGGSTAPIASGQAFTKSTKVSSLILENVASETDIVITPNSGTFSAGVVRAIIYYDNLVAMDDAS